MSDTATRPRRWVGVGEPRPYRLEELEDALGRPTAHELAQVLDVHAKQIYRWREYGLTGDQADDLACRIGRHPLELWPDWTIPEPANRPAPRKRSQGWPRRWIGIGEPRPWSIAPVEARLAHLRVLDRADALGIVHSQIYRWREYGLTTPQAVHCAEQLDVDPGDLWEAWPDPRLS